MRATVDDTGLADTGRYVSLTTFRPDGTATSCVVWRAQDGDALVFRTFARTLKARRLERDPRVGLAVSDREGSHIGPVVYGAARRLSGSESARGHWALTRRVGVLKPLSDLYYRWSLGPTHVYAVDLATVTPTPPPYA